MSAPEALSVDAGGDSFAVTGATPRLSWKSPVSGMPYEVTATVDGAPLATVTTSDHRYVPWPWPPLASGQRVSWQVRTGGESPSTWSEPASFEAGLLDADWSAAWVSPVEAPGAEQGKRPAYTLAATFALAAPVVSARLYATALGLYDPYLNGVRVGTTELAPGATSYDRTLHAQAYDVTDAVHEGENRIEVMLSDGWYRGQVGAFREPAAWGAGALGFRAELHVRLADGTTRVVGTDGTWTGAPSAVTRADLMDGQTTDLTAPRGAAAPALVGRVCGPPISWSPAPAVTVVDERAAVSSHLVRAGVWVVDFGQNASGWVRLTDLGPRGTRTTLDFGEFLGPDGDLDTGHLDSFRPGEGARTFVQRDEVVASGRSDEVFEPHHTVHGFQYVRVARDAVTFDPASITMRVVASDLALTGSFACSDPDLTRLWDVARWSFLGNAVDIPTDCPTRERIGWTGDYQVFVSTAARMYDVSGFSRKWLQSVRDDQLDDGRIANFSPDGRRIKTHLDTQFAMLTGSAGWGDAIVHVPWELWLAYGDREILAESYDAMVRWVDWALDAARTKRHFSREQRAAEAAPHEAYVWDGTFHWGEWCEPKPKDADGNPVDLLKDNPMAWAMADKGEVGTAYLFRSTSTLARVAGLLGRSGDEARYRETAGRVLDAWRTEFLGSDGRTAGDTQAGYVRALSFGLVPDDLREAAATRLVELVAEARGHLSTGFLATADLLPVLADAGRVRTAYEVLLQRTSPSWLGMLDRGATTIWEDWDGIDDHGRAHDSLNHYSKGAVVRFLHSHTLGLRQDEGSAGWRSFTVAPVPHSSLTWAEGTLDTPFGLVTAEWSVTGGDLTVTVVVPAGTTATVRFPDGHAERALPGRWTGTRALPADLESVPQPIG